MLKIVDKNLIGGDKTNTELIGTYAKNRNKQI